jgi:hypothetical protein
VEKVEHDLNPVTATRQICLAAYLDDMLAEVARTRLEAHGIPAFVARDDCGGMQPFMANLGGFRLLIDSAHEAEAREILAAGLPETD